jgi:GT2 family glycosyltransferase
VSGSVGAVVICFNSAEDLPACLQSLTTADAVGSIVVVDNASVDGSAEVVRSFPDARVSLVELDGNTGFAGGCNRGFSALPRDLEWLAFLNPDVAVAPDCLARCADTLRSSSDLGCVAPRLMRANGVTVDSVGQILSRSTLEVRDRGYGGVVKPELLEERPVLAACGALAVFRRQALASVAESSGPWAEHFFCYWEDLELGWRLTNQGWQVLAVPTAVARHGRGAGAVRGRGPLRWRRPPELEACVLSNKWMTLIRHLHPLDLVKRLPVILSWDLALVAAGVARRPHLAKHLRYRLPLILREWRRRFRYPKRRIAALPC